MAIDENNKIVQLCISGIAAETKGKVDEARSLFKQAYHESCDDYEATIAAHYLARHQTTSENTFFWNQKALEHANKACPNQVQAFYPSLYLNLGWSHESLRQYDQAKRYYELAEASIQALPKEQSRDGLSKAVARAQLRLHNAQYQA